MVEFQPQRLTTTDLGSVAYCYSLIYPFRPNSSFSCFLDCSFTPLSYLIPIHSRPSLKTPKIHPLPTSSPGAKHRPPGRSLNPPPASLRCLYLRPRAVCLRLLTFMFRFAPPFADLSLQPVPVGPWGFLPSRFPPRLCVPASFSPSSPPNIGLVRFWCPCRAAFLKKARGQGVSNPWQSLTLVLVPCYLSLPE